jgi:hypothetical protein
MTLQLVILHEVHCIKKKLKYDQFIVDCKYSEEQP